MDILEELANRFKSHTLTPEQAKACEEIRRECYNLARSICDLVPDSRERATALTHLDAVMFNANAGIARRQEATRPVPNPAETGAPPEPKFRKGDHVVFKAGDYAGEVVSVSGLAVTYCNSFGKEYVTGVGNLDLHPNNAFMRDPQS